MANKLKTKKKPIPEPVDLRPEKEEQVEVRSLIKDERTLKITGAVLLLLSIFMFIAFTSYLFTWQEDQDKVSQGAGHFLFADDIKVANLLGRLGAWVSHFFFYKGFGLASYFVCSFFFVSGANLLFEKKIFRLTRNLRYVLVGLLYFSVALHFFSGGSSFSWGGAVGKMISDWMSSFMGTVGTAAVLLIGGLAYFIWRFNPVFTVPKMPSLPKRAVPATEGVGAVVETEKDEKADQPRLFIEEQPEKKNGLKKEGGVVVIPPAPKKGEETIKLEVIEREEEEDDDDEPMQMMELVEDELPEPEPFEMVPPPVVEIPRAPVKPAEAPRIPVSDLELEIKSVPQLTEEEPDVPQVAELPPYEPTLDLRDYKYPALDLLETHGSEKIVQDPAELEANKNPIVLLKNS